MNFVADESVDRQIVERLRNDGHSVWYITEMSPSISKEFFNLCTAEYTKMWIDRIEELRKWIERML